MYIYCITNLINGKKYVGLSTKNVDDTPNYYGSGNLIKSSIKKYGIDNFVKEIMEETEGLELLRKLETYWITKLNTKYPNGYNLTDGGDGLFNPTEEVRKKISEKSKLRCGEFHPNYGKRRNEDTKRKISESNKKYKGEMSSMYGRKMSNETKKKLSISHIGKPRTSEQIEKHKQKMIGRKFNDIHKQKMSDNSGRKLEIYQIDICTNEIICKFDSIESASKNTNIKSQSIWRVLKCKRETTGGFKWKYVNDELNSKIEKSPIRDNCKSILQFDKNNNKINTFNSLTEASIITGINLKSISSCLTGKRKSVNGFIWKYNI